MRYQGLLYRALNPLWAREPLSGEGARRFGGRFNAKGTPALYTSIAIPTAIREANQIGALQPTTLVAYEADVSPVFDTRDDAALARQGVDAWVLAAEDWRLRMREGRLAPTQLLAARLIADGYCGMLVRSFARGAAERDLNLVLWRWGDAPVSLRLIDDEGRLA